MTPIQIGLRTTLVVRIVQEDTSSGDPLGPAPLARYSGFKSHFTGPRGHKKEVGSGPSPTHGTLAPAPMGPANPAL